jgi:hypothetical protein
LELACSESAVDCRISLHDPACRSLVLCLEDHDADVDLAQGGAGEDKRAFRRRRWRNRKWASRAVFSSAVIVAAKSARGGWK